MVRIKQRYLLLNILYPESSGSISSTSASSFLSFHAPTPRHFSSHNLLNLLKAQLTQLFGDHGMGVSISSLKIVYYSQATSTAILRVPRSYFRLAWAALTMLQELPPKAGTQQHPVKCVITVVRVSGTIKKAEEELLRRSRRDVVRAKLSAKSEEGSGMLDRLVGDLSANAPHIENNDLEDSVIFSDDDSVGD